MCDEATRMKIVSITAIVPYRLWCPRNITLLKFALQRSRSSIKHSAAPSSVQTFFVSLMKHAYPYIYVSVRVCIFVFVDAPNVESTWWFRGSGIDFKLQQSLLPFALSCLRTRTHAPHSRSLPRLSHSQPDVKSITVRVMASAWLFKSTITREGIDKRFQTH